MDSAKLTRTLIAGLLSIAAIFIVATGLTLNNLSALQDARQQGAAAREMLEALDAFGDGLADASLAQRAFLIDNDASDLASFQSHLGALGPKLDQVEKLASKESVPQAPLAQLRPAAASATASLEATAQSRQVLRLAAANAMVASIEADQHALDAVRALLETLRSAEHRVLLARRETTTRNYLIAERSCLLMGSLGLLGLLAFWMLARRQIAIQRSRALTTQREREQLRVTLASIGDGVITTDGECQVRFLNEVAETLTGWTAAEAAGKPIEAIFTIVNESTRLPVENPARLALRERAIVGLANHTILIAKDGSERFIEDSGAPIRDGSEQISGAVLVFHDVTPQRKSQIELQAAGEKISLALHAGAILGTWIWEIESDLVTMDARLASVYSVDPVRAAQGVSVENFLSAIHPDDLTQVRILIAEAVRKGGTFRAEYRLRPNSGFLWVEASGTVEVAADGKPLRMPGVVVDISGRRKIARQLALAQRAGGFGTFEWIVSGDELDVSEEYCRVWGIEPQPRLSVDYLTGLVHPDDRAVLGPARRSEGNPIEHAEFRIFRADTRELRWIARRGQRIGSDETGLAHYAGVVYDITNRKRVEDELREQEVQFQALARAMPNLVWTTRPDGHLDWGNDWVYGYSGVAPGTLDGEGWASLVHPDDLPEAAERWQAALLSGAIYEIEFRLRRADRIFRWHLTRAIPVLAADGSIRRWVGTSTDIEDQKVAAANLASLNESLEQQVADRTADRDRIWRLSSDIMLIARFDGVIAAVNPAWRTVLGWSEAELVGRNLFDLLHADDGVAGAAAVTKLSEGVAIPRLNNRYRHKDGSYRWIAWAAAPGAELINAVGRDITAEQEQAEALAAAQDALRQSQKMEAVGQLTGGLAHDFNNLLAAISGNLELMSSRLTNGRLKDVERHVGAAQEAARRAAALTHRLLAFSRRQSLDPKPTDINRLIAGMSDLIRRTVGPAVQVEVVGAGGLWLTLVDQNQLENALLNLCINARDAMPEGGRLTIETANKWFDERMARERDLAPGQYLSLCVTDTGTGMAPDVAAHAFEPFFTTKPLGMGTGLGLSMIYGFARQSGGQVRIYTELGQGTTMCIYLPRHHGENLVEEISSVEDKVRPAARGATVLVVDDEASVRMLVTEVIQDLGYQVIEAADGAAALKILRSNVPINLLITDVGLPGGINGRQVADGGRSVRPDLKILFITGYAENAVVRNGHLERGMQVLTKPFALDALAARITTLMAELPRPPSEGSTQAEIDG